MVMLNMCMCWRVHAIHQRPGMKSDTGTYEIQNNVMGQSCPAQWAWPNAPIKAEIHRSKRKLFSDYNSNDFTPHTSASEKKLGGVGQCHFSISLRKSRFSKMLGFRFRRHECSGNTQEWGKSAVRWKKLIFLEIWKMNWGSAKATNHCGTFT